MNFPILIAAIVAASAINVQGQGKTQPTNADQMVQNILQWLEGAYAQNSRRIRQGTLNEYLPPANTEKPRPFGYPPAGYSPEPPFPFPTNPATGGVTAPEGYPNVEDDNNLLPPENGSGGGPDVSVTTSTVQIPTGKSLVTEEQPAYTYGAPSTTLSNEGTTLGIGTTPAATQATGHPESTPFTSQTFITTTTAGQSIPEVTATTQQQSHESTTAAAIPTTTLHATPDNPSTPLIAETNAPSEQPGTTTGNVQTTTIAGTTLGGYTTHPDTVTTGNSIQTTTNGVTIPESAATTAATTLNPEVNAIPEGEVKKTPSDEDLKHPPHIHAIDVQCGKEMMTINIEFNREFNGIIYSKGFYSNAECRYVQENSGQTKYSFTVSLDKCGTEFVNAFDTQNQSYLENVLVLQNEAGIQEVWDTVRSVRCLWEGNVKDTLSVAFSIGMLSQEIITFSGDTAMAKLDVLLGRGPLGEPANGLVKIGEEMTLVVSVSGDPNFDLQVKDCRAVDVNATNTIQLTDEDGCILKPKLFGAFQKTRETGTSGASIIAFAYFNAFKFPDEMDLMIECNIELCKNDCDICPKDQQQLEPGRRRRRRDVSDNSTVTGDWVTMGKLVRVILPEDLNRKTALEVSARDHICMTIQSFVFSTAVLVSMLVLVTFTSVCLWLKRRERMYLKY